MSKLPRVTGKDLLDLLKRKGFKEVAQNAATINSVARMALAV